MSSEFYTESLQWYYEFVMTSAWF